jgi:predicted peroxiredoxin
MFDLFIVCKEPYLNSLFGCVGTAVVSTKQEGSKVALMLTQEAVVALAEKKFKLASLLIPYEEQLSAVHKQFDFPEDPAEMIKMAKAEGVKVFTCEIWAGLAPKGSLPEALDIEPVEELIRIIAGSKKMLGSF